jgi:basic membrane protein A and related proteins
LVFGAWIFFSLVSLPQANKTHVGDFTMASKLQRGRVRAPIALLSAVSCFFCASVFAQTPPLKVGFVYVSPVFEAGWTQQHDQGRRAMEAALGDKIKTTVVADVPEGADAERVIRDLAAQGNKLIFTTSFGYMEPTLKVAAQFPDVKFVHVSGYKQAANMATVNARYYEARYLAGIVAGSSTKSNTLGYVAAFPIPEVLQGINAFTRGARSVNPKAQVKLVWTQAWVDPARERDAANTLVAQGADVLTNHTGTTAVAQAAEEKRVRFIGYTSNMEKFAPAAQLVAITHHWGAYYTQAAQGVLAGTWKSDDTWGGLKQGMVKLEGWHADVPKAVVDQVSQRQLQIIAGKLHPFTGPVIDNTGKTQWDKDKGAMSDAALNQMAYLVEGVIGGLPK